jgi:ubiquinone/menaquinone biosynthesis C-methylase UbiE
MLNIDIGGFKRRNIEDSNWKIMDFKEGADYLYDLNSGNRMNLDDETVDNYYTSYTLMLARTDLIKFILKEMFRTLKVGGLVRIVNPDIEKAIYWYMNSPELLKFKYAKPTFYPETKLGCLMALFYTEDLLIDGKVLSTGTKTSFDFETMSLWLEQSGFSDVKKLDFNICSEIFKGKDFARYKNRGLFVEAKK